MGRLVSVLLAVLVVASIADAKTPLRKCRKACMPLVSSVCPPKGKALRKCRTPILRECRREGIAACAFGLPTGGPDDGAGNPTTTTTTPAPTTTSTTVTLPGVTTATTLPSVSSVSSAWVFDGVLVQPGCNLGFDIVSTLSVLQDGTALSGTIEGVPAAGAVDGAGWTFTWHSGNLPAVDHVTCMQRFTVSASGVASPGPAEATATATCTDSSTCEARWTGSVTRVP